MSFYLKYPNSEVTTIMLTVYIEGGKRVKYSTRKKIKPEYWDLKTKRPKKISYKITRKSIIIELNQLPIIAL